MVSRIKRVASRSAVPAAHESEQARNSVDQNLLLAQVRAGLTEIEATLAALGQREQDLLAEASGLYEQLKSAAGALADVRRDKEIAADNADKFAAAIHSLERQLSGAQTLEQTDPSRHEALIAVPKA